MDAFINLGITLLLLVTAYFTGTHLERRHFDAIRRREQALLRLPAITTRRLPPGTQVMAASLVSGNVVVSLDYFKRFLAGLRAIIGGRIKAYEPLLDRARREAMLRMRERAQAAGYDMVINVRLETSRLANTDGGRRTAGVEILAFGTALKTAGAGQDTPHS
ncbi:MAG: heavy metal-binding domain-containing protein [Myxococcales bacterium]|nr:heavy metal-binding domain-containing protein [Myxococcales bacterium]